MLRRVMIAADSYSGSIVDLIDALNPNTWARCDDHSASSSVTNSGSSSTAGVLRSAVTGSALGYRDTSAVSSPGLSAGTGLAFYLSGTNLIAMPSIPLSDSIGWTVFFIVRVDSSPPVATIFQLTRPGDGCPEVGVIDAGSGKFRFRLMLSGVQEVGMTATPLYAYGTKLAVAVRKRAGGVVDLYIDGVHVASSTAAPAFVYGSSPVNFGGAVFGPHTTYYSIPGAIDECALWAKPLTDAQCESLTSTGAV